MKNSALFSAKNVFGLTAAAALLAVASSASAFGPYAAGSQGSLNNNCGCDNKQEIEMYVQNVINDSQQRGATCQASMHIPACIISYCSICGSNAGLMSSCIKTGMDYLANSAGFCAPQAAQPMPMYSFYPAF